MNYKLTLVTALFDIGRGDISDGFKRDFTHYVDSFTRLLTVDLPMVIYCEDYLEEHIWKHRDKKNTRVIIRSLDHLRDFPFYDKIQEIRTSEKWLTLNNQYPYYDAEKESFDEWKKKSNYWLVRSPQATLELYNPLVMYKQFALNDASLFNFFDTDNYIWVDAGISNTIGDPTQYFNPSMVDKIIQDCDKMFYVCFPYDGQSEVHGFDKAAMNDFAGTDTKYVARGGIFGGNKPAINHVNSLYYEMLNNTLQSNFMGTEESIFTILSYRYPDLFNIRMIDSNGLVYKYLEDVNKRETKQYEELLAIYVLTYNLPEQFKLWVESIDTTHKIEFEKAKKYVINNSTDPDVEEEYKELFDKYGFDEFKFNNIGINDGRFFAAQHFNDAPHKYMVFFEDDMLLHPNNSELCINGFPRYTNKLFSKCMGIIDSNKLDYLKMTFSEFYGDNHINWAWYNLPSKEKKDEYFPQKDNGVDRAKTKIDYTGTLQHLPYAVGEYHYCNWPIMFTKEGNYKVFLKHVYEHKYEQTWMSQTIMTMRESNDFKAGCLLASPVIHNRVYHYDGSKRRENKHYTN